MDDKQFRSRQFAKYLPAVEGVLSRSEVAYYADVSQGTASNWYAGERTPHRPNLDKIGRLAAVITFLDNELSFETEDTISFVNTITLDPETFGPTTMLEQIKAGNSALVVQEAIRLSIVEE